MKRLLVLLLVSAIVLLGLLDPVPAQARLIAGFSLPKFYGVEGAIVTPAKAVPATTKDLITQLESEVLPQLETILSPEQRETFKTSVADGTSFRKAFKSLTLTPGQKAQLKTVLKSMPKQDAFASLTPAQKKKLFMKNKELFIPTSEKIADKINAGMNKNEGLMPTLETLEEKISTGIKAAEAKLGE